MEYGPCGGVAADGSCEVADAPCVFLGRDTISWHGIRAVPPESREVGSPEPDPIPAPVPPAAADRLRRLLGTRPIVVADFPARPLDADDLEACAGILRGTVDAVLAGDSPRARVQFPPAYRARLIRDAGLEVWSGLTCRDRNRVAIEAELAALAHAGVAGVHCVTGDHPRGGSRADAAPVFDLDSTETAALAAAAGHLVSVAEAPAAPPTDRRANRLLEKERAGAEVCFVNHAGGVEPVRAFIAATRSLGSRVHFVPCVPVVVDRGSGALLATFAGLALPAGFLESILAADDVRAAGIRAAIELSRRMLDLDGVVGIDLSGGAAAGAESAFAEALAEIATAVAA